jgi:hypothetical protein
LVAVGLSSKAAYAPDESGRLAYPGLIIKIQVEVNPNITMNHLGIFLTLIPFRSENLNWLIY